MIVNNMDQRLIVIGDIVLLPGNNDIDTSLWKKAEKEYNLENLFDNDKIKIISQTQKKGDKTIELGFKDYPFKKKEDLILNTYNLKTLKKWQSEETDMPIRTKLEKRISSITDKKIKEKYGKPDNHI